MAKISDAFPVIDVSIVLNGDISKVSTEELVKDKNVVLVGVPGAFTPTCHAQHLPGYIENIDEFTEKGYSVIDVIKTAKKITENNIDYQIESPRKGDVAELVANSALARDLIGWDNNSSSLEKILNTTWDIYRL